MRSLEKGSQPTPHQLGGWGKIAVSSPGGVLDAKRFSCIPEASDGLSWNLLEAKFWGAWPTLPLSPLKSAYVDDRAFSVTAARAWNALPSSVRSAPSLLQFRRDLKTELFQSSYHSVQMCDRL